MAATALLAVREVCQLIFVLNRSKQWGGPHASTSVLRAVRVQRVMHNDERHARKGESVNTDAHDKLCSCSSRIPPQWLISTPYAHVFNAQYVLLSFCSSLLLAPRRHASFFLPRSISFRRTLQFRRARNRSTSLDSHASHKNRCLLLAVD